MKYKKDSPYFTSSFPLEVTGADLPPNYSFQWQRETLIFPKQNRTIGFTFEHFLSSPKPTEKEKGEILIFPCQDVSNLPPKKLLSVEEATSLAKQLICEGIEDGNPCKLVDTCSKFQDSQATKIRVKDIPEAKCIQLTK